MRRLLLVTTLLCISPALLGAQDGDLFSKLDKNADGQVASDEVDENAKELFERLLRRADANGDGKLSKDEFAKANSARPDNRPEADAPGRPALEPARILERADANGDGKISREEAPQPLRSVFDRIDANSDDAVDKAELERFAQRMRAGGAAMPGAQPRPEHLVGAMLLRAIDADKDGEISSSELADAAKALAQFDTNKDGKLDAAELRAQVAGGDAPAGREAILRRLKEADANGDGKLSKDEAPERLKQVFDRIDANSDGQIEPGELREFLGRQP